MCLWQCLHVVFHSFYYYARLLQWSTDHQIFPIESCLDHLKRSVIRSWLISFKFVFSALPTLAIIKSTSLLTGEAKHYYCSMITRLNQNFLEGISTSIICMRVPLAKLGFMIFFLLYRPKYGQVGCP